MENLTDSLSLVEVYGLLWDAELSGGSVKKTIDEILLADDAIPDVTLQHLAGSEELSDGGAKLIIDRIKSGNAGDDDSIVSIACSIMGNQSVNEARKKDMLALVLSRFLEIDGKISDAHVDRFDYFFATFLTEEEIGELPNSIRSRLVVKAAVN